MVIKRTAVSSYLSDPHPSSTIEYRKSTAIPTVPGWYYAKYMNNPFIDPVYYRPFSPLFDNGIADGLPGNHYTWYGPVSEIRDIKDIGGN